MTDEQVKVIEERRRLQRKEKENRLKDLEAEQVKLATKIESMREDHQKHVVQFNDEDRGIQYTVRSFRFCDDPFAPCINTEFELSYKNADGSDCRLSRGIDGEAYMLEWDAEDLSFPFTPASISHNIQDECLKPFLVRMRGLLKEILECALKEQAIPAAVIRPVR